MMTYAEQKCFTLVELQMWAEAKRFVDKVTSNDCRCHELARAVNARLRKQFASADLRVEDGKVGPVEHSWIRIMGTGNIIDVYRPGCVPAVLLLDELVSHEYEVIGERTDVRGSVVNQLDHEMRR